MSNENKISTKMIKKTITKKLVTRSITMCISSSIFDKNCKTFGTLFTKKNTKKTIILKN